MTRRTTTTIALTTTILVLILLAFNFKGQQDRTGRTMGINIDNASDGVLISGVVPDSPAERARLMDGDVIFELGDAPVRDLGSLNEAAFRLTRGQAVPVKVFRQGRELTLELIPGVAFPWFSFCINLLAVLGYLAVAVMALLRTPGGLQANLVFAFTAAVAVELALPTQFGPGLYGVESVTLFFLSGLQLALELHLASSIPRPMEWFQSRPWLLRSYYITGLSVALIAAVTLVSEGFGLSLVPWSSAQMETVFYEWGLLAWAAAVLVILMTQARLARSATDRTQVLLVTLAVALWASFNLILMVLPRLGAPVPNWLYESNPLVLLAYPVAIFIAVFRFNLFDLEQVVKRSLVLTALTTVLVAASLGLAAAGSFLIAARFGESTQIVVVALGMLALGTAIRPLSEWLQKSISRRVFPERVAMRQRLALAAGQLPGRGSLAAMGLEVVTQIRELFHPSTCSLFIVDPVSGLLIRLASSTSASERRFEQAVLAGAGENGVAQLGASGFLQTLAPIRRSDPDFADRLQQLGTDRVLALLGNESLVGLLLLGERPPDMPYHGEETDLLSLFTHNSATVLESAILFESASSDLLTGLLRPEALNSLLRTEVVRASRYHRPLTLGMIEIDQLSLIREQRGELAAAALLRSVASDLRATIRTSDAMGRSRGEQLALFMPETTLDDAQQMASKLCAKVANGRWPCDDRTELTISVSIGLAGLTGNTEQRASDLIDVARHNLELTKGRRQNAEG